MSMVIGGFTIANRFVEFGVRNKTTGDVVYISDDSDDVEQEVGLADIVGKGQRHEIVARQVFEGDWTAAQKADPE